MSKFKDFIKSKKAKVMAVIISVAAIMAVPVTASAAETTGGSTFPVTSDMLNDVTTNMNAAIAVAVPVGIGVMGVLLGVYLVPKIIKRLAK